MYKAKLEEPVFSWNGRYKAEIKKISKLKFS